MLNGIREQRSAVMNCGSLHPEGVSDFLFSESFDNALNVIKGVS